MVTGKGVNTVANQLNSHLNQHLVFRVNKNNYKPFSNWTSGAWLIRLLKQKKKKKIQTMISVADVLIEGFLCHQRLLLKLAH